MRKEKPNADLGDVLKVSPAGDEANPAVLSALPSTPPPPGRRKRIQWSLRDKDDPNSPVKVESMHSDRTHYAQLHPLKGEIRELCDTLKLVSEVIDIDALFQQLDTYCFENNNCVKEDKLFMQMKNLYLQLLSKSEDLLCQLYAKLCPMFDSIIEEAIIKKVINAPGNLLREYMITFMKQSCAPGMVYNWTVFVGVANTFIGHKKFINNLITESTFAIDLDKESKFELFDILWEINERLCSTDGFRPSDIVRELNTVMYDYLTSKDELYPADDSSGDEFLSVEQIAQKQVTQKAPMVPADSSQRFRARPIQPQQRVPSQRVYTSCNCTIS